MGRDGGILSLRLLTRLFIRRLLDNDLISPHADRHESLAVLYAVVVSLAVFVTFFVATPYLSAFVQLPGPTALSALSDRFLFVAVSMTVCALAALLVWDALALEPRDTAILGPLPIASSTITCAKLAAALVFGAVFSIAVNAVPSVLYPAFLTANLRGISGGGVLRLMGAQAITVVMAGLFGFFGVLAVRGLLRLALGARGFGRVSSVAQSAFIVCAVTALILTPTLGAPALRDWITGVGQPRWPARPVLWHIGVNEAIAGDVVVNTPVVTPPRLTLTAPLQQQDAEARLAYRSLIPHLKPLARTAWLILPLVTILAIVTFLWNNRRLPEQSARRPRPSRARARLRTLVERLTHRDPEARAGFFFTLQTLTRSAPHRIIVAVSVAVAVTFPFVTMVRGLAHGQVETASMPLGLFGIQIMVLSSLVAGVRYAVMVPAELAANWTFRMAWLGDERIFLKGVKRAALLVSVIGPLLVLLPLHVALFGITTALVHSLFGLLFAVAVLDGIFLGYRRLPFACSYLPPGDAKVLWPVAAAILLLVPYAFAYIERLALQSPPRTLALAALLGAIILVAKIVHRVQRREPWPASFDERPAPATQRLGLFERMAIRDD
jgi:hypothetical protein